MSITSIRHWPICHVCKTLDDQKLKVEKPYTFFSPIIAVLAMLFSMYYGLKFDLYTFQQSFLAAPLAILLFFSGRFAFKIHCRILAKRLELSFGHEPIKIRRLARQAFRKGFLFEFTCYFSEYAIAFNQLNSAIGILKIRPKT